MISFWFWVTSTGNSRKWLWLGLAAFVFALLFLETALLFPVYLFLLCLILPDPDRSKALRKTLPFWGLAIVYFILWCLKGGVGGGFAEKLHHLQISWPSYFVTLTVLLKWYLGNLFFPENIVFIKNFQPVRESLVLWNAGLALALFGLGVLFWILKKGQARFPLAWFLSGFVFMVPASIVHAYSMGMVIEPYWFYFSSMGFFMLTALLLWDLRQRIGLIVWRALVITIVLFWGIVSYRHHVISHGGGIPRILA